MERVPEYVIVEDMVHVRSEDQNRTLCGKPWTGSTVGTARGGFCLKCQELHQMPGVGLSLVSE
jgi:hypothetical protein